MIYDDLLDGIKRFGSTIEDICQLTLGVSPKVIHERVIIAPWWEPHVFDCLGNDITYLSRSESSNVKVWEIKNENFCISYIKTGIGAPVLTDTILALGLTACNKAIFIGSVGGLTPELNIGDIVIPRFSISGVGVSRYLTNESIKSNNTFGEVCYPNCDLFKTLHDASIKHCNKDGICYHTGMIFSTDSIFAQYAHLDEIIGMGCNGIEMETAPAFKSAALVGISLGALLSVSDNTVIHKSLFSGRLKSDMEHRKNVRRMVFPKIILDALE